MLEDWVLYRQIYNIAFLWSVLPWTTCPWPLALCNKIALPVACLVPSTALESTALTSFCAAGLFTEVSGTDCFTWGFCNVVFCGVLCAIIFFWAPGSTRGLFWTEWWFLWGEEWCFVNLCWWPANVSRKVKKWVFFWNDGMHGYRLL